jgi:tetratricopeptide (TPR) repeat protein
MDEQEPERGRGPGPGPEQLCRSAEAALAAGDYSRAERLGLDAILAARATPDLTLARSLDALARVYTRTARLEPAEALHRRALDVRRTIGGEDSILFAASLNALAGCVWRRGDRAAAEQMLRRALEIQRRLPPDGAPGVLADTLGNLGILASERRDLATAEPLFREALGTNQRAFGPDSRPVADTLNNLAHSLMKAGRVADAVPLLRRASGVLQRLFPPEHPAQANALTNLGGALAVLGRRAEARPILERALFIRRKALGNRHPALIVVVHDLAQLLRQSGERDAAEPLFLEAIELCEKYSPGGADLAMALNNYACMLRDEGRYSTAAPWLLRGAEALARSQGPAHRATIDAWLRAAECCLQCGKVEDAARGLATAIHAILRHPGSADPGLPDMMNLYAVILDEAGLPGRAARVRARAERLRRRAAGPNRRRG